MKLFGIIVMIGVGLALGMAGKGITSSIDRLDDIDWYGV